MTPQEIEKLFEGAPEGTTHYQPEGEFSAAWVKRDEGDWLLGILDDGIDKHWGRVGRFSAKEHLLIPRPAPTPEWSGEGLPPVGTVCIFRSEEIEEKLFHKELRNDIEVEVIAHFHINDLTVAAFVFDVPGGRHVEQAVARCFSPIRTAEQIAADEREAAVKEACAEIEDGIEKYNTRIDCSVAIRATIETMIDAGYRKA